MGIQRSEESTSGPAFAADVLRIEVTSNTGLHLTVVNLPGLIATINSKALFDLPGSNAGKAIGSNYFNHSPATLIGGSTHLVLAGKVDLRPNKY